MNKEMKDSNVFGKLKQENNRLNRQLIGEKARIKRAIGMIKSLNSHISDDEEDDELLTAISELFENYDIP